MPFNRVIVRADAGPMELSVGAFLALPLPERIRHILHGSVEFYRGDLPVDRGLALRALRSQPT